MIAALLRPVAGNLYVHAVIRRNPASADRSLSVCVVSDCIYCYGRHFHPIARNNNLCVYGSRPIGIHPGTMPKTLVVMTTNVAFKGGLWNKNLIRHGDVLDDVSNSCSERALTLKPLGCSLWGSRLSNQ